MPEPALSTQLSRSPERTLEYLDAQLLPLPPVALYAHLSQQLGSGAIDSSLLTFAQENLPAGVAHLNTADLPSTQHALETGQYRWLLSTTMQEPHLTTPNLDALATLCKASGCTLLIDTTLTPLYSVNRYGAQAILCSTQLLSGWLPSDTNPPSENPNQNSLNTLPLRMRAHSGNAQAIADVLVGHPSVRAVYHAGLSTHPQFEYAEMHFEQGFGGMVYADIPAPDFAQRLPAWLQGRHNWGSAHSAVWSVPQRPNLYGLWAGLEDIDDLLTELEGALA